MGEQVRGTRSIDRRLQISGKKEAAARSFRRVRLLAQGHPGCAQGAGYEGKGRIDSAGPDRVAWRVPEGFRRTEEGDGAARGAPVLRYRVVERDGGVAVGQSFCRDRNRLSRGRG